MSAHFFPPSALPIEPNEKLGRRQLQGQSFQNPMGWSRHLGNGKAAFSKQLEDAIRLICRSPWPGPGKLQHVDRRGTMQRT
jgi:hypothetical protein